ncbi:adenosinetriphosphatase [Plasmodium inui San Antonio 1]|uniref:Adenosinetriphosphatase n=1 Tax=Plasmodium inui San Antonio 1 TaxID=1237626 RepID=W7A8M3_9APIC|nr:adenosinetriphosphatase [Plasmodium inui San Antonio 1]EUD67638.1 adenosinetriphosphatase [Plasmodium inui San Antonio 1]
MANGRKIKRKGGKGGKPPLLRHSKLRILFYIRRYLERKRREARFTRCQRDGSSSGGRGGDGEENSPSRGAASPVTFEELGVEDWLVKISKTVQITHPTKIQQLCLPLIMRGHNVIGTSETGTGKTICYCWGILQELNKNSFGVFALVLLPTRELVVQVVEQFLLYGYRIGIKILSCIGGSSLIEQRRRVLAKPHVVVGTPGRTSDIMDNCEDVKNCFKRLSFFVLDEADLLLRSCYESKLEVILRCLPKGGGSESVGGSVGGSLYGGVGGRRTLLFSSTMSDSIELLADTFPQGNLILVNVNKKQKPLKNLDQRYIYVDEIAQMTYLVYLLRKKLPDQSGIIFTDNSYRCELIYTVLRMLGGFSVESIHSSKDPKKRIAALSKIKNGGCKVLVATDIISRGIDIPKTSFVINFDFPNDAVLYVHRVGRTARANRKGVAISFVDKRDVNSFNAVMQIMKSALKPWRLRKKEVLQDMFQVGRALKKAELLLEEREDARREHRRMQRFVHRAM